MINVELRQDLLIENFIGPNGQNLGNINLGYLEKRAVSNYTFVGSDAGSGARKDISIWQPVLPSNQDKPADASDWCFIGHVAVYQYNVPPNTATYVLRQRFVNKARPGYTPSTILFGPDPNIEWRNFKNYWYFCPPAGCFAIFACDFGGYSVGIGTGLSLPNGDINKMANFKILSPLYFTEFFKKYSLKPPPFANYTTQWTSDGSRLGAQTEASTLEHGLFIARQNANEFSNWVYFKYFAETTVDDPPIIRYGVAPATSWNPLVDGEL